MMYLDTTPRLIQAEMFSAMPDQFRRKGVSTEWADANRPGPADRLLYRRGHPSTPPVISISSTFPSVAFFGLRLTEKWTLVIEYEGWPNGLKISREGRIFVADYRRGIMELDTKSRAHAAGYWPHAIRSPSRAAMICISHPNGDIYFTDQGQTGLHDPTGRVYRLKPSGQLDCLINTASARTGWCSIPSKPCCLSR